MKTPLTTAAYDGPIERVRELLAQGKDANGDDEPKYTDEAEGCLTGEPYYTPLGEAARAGHAAIVRLLLDAGAKVDRRNYRNETAFVLAAQRGQVEVMKALALAGADVHVVCCMGNALGYAVVSSDMSRECIAYLIELGVKADVADPFSRTAIDQIVDSLPKRGKLDKWSKQQLAALEMVLPAAGSQEAKAREALERFGTKSKSQAKKEAKTEATFADLGSAKATKDAKWAERVRAFIKPAGEANEDLERLCRLTLASKAAIAHAKWPALVREVVAASRTYGDLTEEAYGERLSIKQMDEDEGSVLDMYADDHLHTFDWVLRLLATPDAVARKDWADLVVHLCEAKAKAIGTMSFGDEEIASLVSAAKKHPKHAAIVKAAKRAFPFATI
jgi:hypothetical protein